LDSTEEYKQANISHFYSTIWSSILQQPNDAFSHCPKLKFNQAINDLNSAREINIHACLSLDPLLSLLPRILVLKLQPAELYAFCEMLGWRPLVVDPLVPSRNDQLFVAQKLFNLKIFACLVVFAVSFCNSFFCTLFYSVNFFTGVFFVISFWKISFFEDKNESLIVICKFHFISMFFAYVLE